MEAGTNGDPSSTARSPVSLPDEPLAESATTWGVDRAVFPEATWTNIPLMEGLDQVQSATLSRVLRGPQSRWGLFGVFIPPHTAPKSGAVFRAAGRGPRSLHAAARGNPGQQEPGLLGGLLQRSDSGRTLANAKSAPSQHCPTSWLAESLVQQLEGVVEEGIVNRSPALL